MPNLLIIGAQWGDEGKGKVVDYFSQYADVVVRFQGGPNAGHTLVVDGQKTVLHLLPSGVLYDGKLCVIGNGCVIDPNVLLKEMEALKTKGRPIQPNHLLISERAHVIFPHHRAIDVAREQQSGAGKIGTTGRGIGPAYEDKVARRGIRMADLVDPDLLRRRLAPVIEEKNRYLKLMLNSAETLDLGKTVEEYAAYGQVLAPYLGDSSVALEEARVARKNILFEGAQGSMLDVDYGTYPFVTSSNTIAGNACAGAGIGPRCIDHAFGISKAYTTRVGSGPFPTEEDNAVGEKLRAVGVEFGATTGRPRRCGWLDVVVLKTSIRLNGLSGLVLTKLDVLSEFDTLKIATHYLLDGKRIDTLPPHAEMATRCQPVYIEMPGWKKPIGEVRSFEELPEAARKYVRKIEELVRIPIVMVGVGAGRQDTLILQNPFY